MNTNSELNESRRADAADVILQKRRESGSAGKRGLGKGLGALLTGVSASHSEPETPEVVPTNGVTYVDINKIEPNSGQPRKRFDDDMLSELAESIKAVGIIQPLIVNDDNGRYTIIAGERRWRAARKAHLTEVPVIVKNYTPAEALQIALIENIQRQDLNPIEEAACFKRLIDDFFFTQNDIAERIGKSRATVSYAMSLLNLLPHTQDLIIDGMLSATHGRVLLQLKDQANESLCAETIIEKSLNMAQSEALVKTLNEGERKVPDFYAHKTHYTNFEEELADLLGTKVSIQQGKKKGKIEIEFFSPDELDRLVGMIKGEQYGNN